MINRNQDIICTNFDNGKIHDFKLFKKSKLPLKKNTSVEVDLGYIGIYKIHKKCEIPAKKPKNGEISQEDKELNHIKSSSRIIIEQVNAKIKVFQIFSQKYRNRRKRFNLRFNLICGLINFDHKIGVKK